MSIFSALHLACLGETWTSEIFIFCSYLPEKGQGCQSLQGLGRNIGRVMKGDIL